MIYEYSLQLREKRLKPTCAMLSKLSQKKYEHDRMYRDEMDWKHRIQCDGTPNPRVVQELNTYLFVWRQMSHVSDDQNSYVGKCLEIFNIMDAVDDIVDLPLDFSNVSHIGFTSETIRFPSLNTFFIGTYNKKCSR